jgi:tetratricopeptide (TPR) repeat protein
MLVKAMIERSIVRSELGDYRGALQDNKRALELDSRNIEIYKNNIGLKFQLEKFAEAIVDCNKVLEHEPNNAMIFFRRGEAKLKLNDKNGACLDWHNAVNLGYKEAMQTISKNCNE